MILSFFTSAFVHGTQRLAAAWHRAASIGLYGFLCLGLGLGIQTSSFANEENQLTADTIIAALQASNQPRNMQVPFREIRHYQLKRTDMVFTGTMRLHPDHGISIEYSSPVSRIFILTPTGLRIRQDEASADRMAPDEAGTIVAVFLDLLQLNSDRLKEQFEMEAHADEPNQWTLELTPKTADLKRFFQVIDLEGGEDQLHAIYMQNGHARWKRIEFSEPSVEWNPTEAELNAYF